MPADTIYGLSCQAEDRRTVERLHSLKDRAASKPFIILIPNYEILNWLSISKSSLQTAGNYWPGALTIICEAPGAPRYLTRGLATLAVRIPDQPELLKLMETTGPLISTSANPEGGKPAKNIEGAMAYFGDSLDFYIDRGPAASELPSTIARAVGGKLDIIRQGALIIKKEDLV